MGIFRHSKPTISAEMPIEHGYNLTLGAKLGIRDYQVARENPALAGHPIVGKNPWYFRDEANKVYQAAVKTDPDLRAMIDHARELNEKTRKVLDYPFAIQHLGQRAIDPVFDQVELMKHIKSTVDAKGLTFTIENEHLDQARGVARFCIDQLLKGQMLFEQPASLRESSHYAGWRPTIDINRVDYWREVDGLLVPSQIQVAPVEPQTPAR